MKTLGDAFVARLHAEHLKPLGFRKTRHTFVRTHGEYAEHYSVQGSAWNDRRRSWICYLNCGISFNGVAPRKPDSDFPRTHAWMRSGAFVRDSAAQYEVTDDNVEKVAWDVARVIRVCASYFERRHQVLRRAYDDRRYERGFLADPELSDDR